MHLKLVLGFIGDGSSGAKFSSKGAWVTVDFGKEVGGLISLTFDSTTSTSSISLSFTESAQFIRPAASDDSSFPDASTTYDGVLLVPSTSILQSQESIQRPMDPTLRLITSWVPLSYNCLEFEFVFAISNDPGFVDDEDFLTKLWYAGAYTVQTNTVPVNTGRMHGEQRYSRYCWTIIVDGANVIEQSGQVTWYRRPNPIRLDYGLGAHKERARDNV
ncbi:hypothetical protein D9758_012434 [Tetrapyrgos nigripes]|uniref:Uncharacterized protein n=1 Tax=Tetrapyrgos nigripes TaxID=182062 RepID=A0A8H5D832_9AGAR|nr:hypothetical protein D9758_012434 [Tetrapyrgos nigripes]